MDMNVVSAALIEIIKEIKEKLVINNVAIRADIFGILESVCTVIYYPLPNEKNRGFHIKKIVGDKLEDFVFINTDKPLAEQIFAAAHEFGHICNVAKRVWGVLNMPGQPTEDEEEEITNRFAAELLMPTDPFCNSFLAHMKELNVSSGKVKTDELARVMVMLMNDFLVPYVAVRKRLVETSIMASSAEDYLIKIESLMLKFVEIFANDQNTYLGKGTKVKTIPGIRDLINKAEENQSVDIYLLKKIKKDFDFADVDAGEGEIEIHIGDSNNG